MRYIVTCIVLPFSLALFTPTPASAEARVVETGKSYQSIGAAVSDAPSGATIEVTGGTYREAIVVTKAVILLGKNDGRGRPLIDGGTATSAIEIMADNVTVDGFEITASQSRQLRFGIFSSYSEEACVLVRASGATISNNRISGCHYGVYLRDVESGSVELNEIEDNRVGGVFVLNSRNVGVRENKVTGNGYNGIGIGSVVFPPGMMQAMRPLAGDVIITAETRPLEAVMSSDIEVAGNDVSGHGHAGIVAGFSRRIAILSNKAYRNGGQPMPKTNPPVVLGSSPDIHGYGIGLICDTHDSRVENNQTESNVGLGILLDTAFANHVGANLVTSNGIGIGLFGSTDNSLEGNRVQRNTEYGIRIERGLPYVNPSVGNVVLANDLDSNGINAFDTSGKDTAPAKAQGVPKGGPVDATMLRTANRWDDGSRGNHHSDFDEENEGFVDTNGDGVSEKARSIPGGKAVDRFPLAQSDL